MPQKAPISWLILFLIYSMTLILFCMLNYSMYKPSSHKSIELKNINLNSMNWKW